jgi:hypothetical protein
VHGAAQGASSWLTPSTCPNSTADQHSSGSWIIAIVGFQYSSRCTYCPCPPPPRQCVPHRATCGCSKQYCPPAGILPAAPQLRPPSRCANSLLARPCMVRIKAVSAGDLACTHTGKIAGRDNQLSDQSVIESELCVCEVPQLQTLIQNWQLMPSCCHLWSHVLDPFPEESV